MTLIRKGIEQIRREGLANAQAKIKQQEEYQAKEQEVYMGEVPMMTHSGTFITNGVQRVVVNQMHRSPGVFFDHDKGKSHASGKLLFNCRVIPNRGSWLDFEYDVKDLLYFKIDRKKKILLSTLLIALGYSKEDIVNHYYEKDKFSYVSNLKKWKTKFNPENYKTKNFSEEVIDAKTGKIVVKSGDKINFLSAKKLFDDGLKEIFVSNESLYGQFIHKDILVGEENKLKHGKFLPGVNIPIISKKEVPKNLKCILVLAWNFFEEIKSNNPQLSNNFISIKELEHKKL